MNRPKRQGTAFESWLVKWLQKVPTIQAAGRLAEGGSLDEGDVKFYDARGDAWVVECKATQTLNVTRVLSKARQKSSEPQRTILAWKRLTRTGDNKKRTPDGEPVVIVMGMDTFADILRNR